MPDTNNLKEEEFICLVVSEDSANGWLVPGQKWYEGRLWQRKTAKPMIVRKQRETSCQRERSALERPGLVTISRLQDRKLYSPEIQNYELGERIKKHTLDKFLVEVENHAKRNGINSMHGKGNSRGETESEESVLNSEKRQQEKKE